MAIGVLGVLTVLGTTAMVYTTSNSRSAQYSRASESSYSLAEAGMAQALSVLNNALDPKTGSLLPSTTINFNEGTATYSGTIDANYVWTITSVGKAKNAIGGSAQATRTLTRTATVRGLNNGATVGAWSRFYHDSTSTCLTISAVTIPDSISSRGGLCLTNGAHITGATTKVSVGTNVTISTAASTSVTDQAGAGTGWTTSANIASSNNVYATNSIAGAGSSPNLDATSFGFAIPADATINGIVVNVERKAATASRVSDTDVLMLKAGAAVGTDKAVAGTWTTTDAVRTYGTSSDLWGTTWTPAEVNAGNFGLRFKAQATSGTAVVASVDLIEIVIYYTPASSIGASGANIQEIGVGGTCKYGSQAVHTPCSSVDKVYADTITNTPADLSKPTIDLAYWYQNAQPGPKHNCTTGSFPGGFDNDSTLNHSHASIEVTPTGSSYTCQVKDGAGNLLGELSWNHTTHVLKITGTIFVDGDWRFDDDGQLVNYQGRGIIYASGDVEFDELVCAGGNGTNNCVTNGMQNWDPSQNMMVVLSGANSEYDQGSTQTQSQPSGLQGILYAVGTCTIHQNFHISGPVICNVITLPSDTNGYPTYYNWPDLGALVEGQMYGDPASSPDFEIVLGNTSG
jgi:hypothetical protein